MDRQRNDCLGRRSRALKYRRQILRYSSGSDTHANTFSHPNCDSDAHSNGYAYIYRDCNAYSDSKTYANPKERSLAKIPAYACTSTLEVKLECNYEKENES
jgi:hypothetical protein